MAEEKKEAKMHVYFPDPETCSEEEKVMAVKVINNYLGEEA